MHCRGWLWLVSPLVMVACSGSGGGVVGVDGAGDIGATEGVVEVLDGTSTELLDDASDASEFTELPYQELADLGETNDAGDTLEDTDAHPDWTDAHDGVEDTGETVECQPLDCMLACPFGFVEDDNGCPICECVKCADDGQCGPLLPFCSTPRCMEDGTCQCNCEEYESTWMTCQSGTKVPVCQCTLAGYHCIPDAHLQCAEHCKPGHSWQALCADMVTPFAKCSCEQPLCKPVCGTGPEEAEGWVDSCNGQWLLLEECGLCESYCAAPPEGKEGFYSGCTGELIQEIPCAPVAKCQTEPEKCQDSLCTFGQSQQLGCPGGTSVETCWCTPPCEPVCLFEGSKSEGWYDGCSEELITWEECSGCTVSCDMVGSKSEGWYSSCSGLVTWTVCSMGTWECDPMLAAQCGTDVQCTGQGGTVAMFGAEFGICCPGLVALADMGVEDGTCVAGSSGVFTCAPCGDGSCTAPENKCNCPEDCGQTLLPALGDVCVAGVGCGEGWICLTWGGGVDGVCSVVCDPLLQDESQCGPDYECVPVQDHQAPGFCLAKCDPVAEGSCPQGLACGAYLIPGQALSPTCGVWPECDPVAQSGCGMEQCHLSKGFVYCGVPGSGADGTPCSADKLCEPGLTCGFNNYCMPSCSSDDQCIELPEYYEFCMKQAGAEYGHCMVYLF